MDTLLLIELLWCLGLGSGIGYLLTRRTVAGGLSGAFVVLLGLGLWYGWRGATYLWAAQWTVYAAGILLLWAWLAVDNPLQTSSRLSLQDMMLCIGFIALAMQESLRGPALLHSLPKVLPDLSDIGFIWAHAWAPIFVWLTVVLAIVWFLIASLWEPLGGKNSF